MKMCPFEMMGTTHPSPQCQIPEDLNPWTHSFENLKFHKNKHPVRSSAEGHDYKTLWTDPEDNAAVAYSSRRLCYFPFLVIAVSSGTFWYVFMECISACYTLHWSRTKSSALPTLKPTAGLSPEPVPSTLHCDHQTPVKSIMSAPSALQSF
jgi:hypothetical protein